MHTAGGKEKLVQVIQQINDLAPEKSMAVCTLPDTPRETCARGMSDEERLFDEELWACGQFTDPRWFIPHECADDRSAAHSICRRWVCGRLVVADKAKAKNEWFMQSEIALARRPLQKPIVKLPKLRDLLLPESLSAHEDLRTGDRPRPGREQAQAQKGQEVNLSLISMALRDMNFEAGSTLTVISLTPYIEDLTHALVAFRMEAKNSPNICNIQAASLRSMSFHMDKGTFDFDVARLQSALLEHWQSKALDCPASSTTRTLPP